MPLPFFVDKVTDELHPDTPALLALAASKIEERGIEAWFDATHEDFGVDPARYRKLTDTLDVWFDSGSTHQTVLGGPEGVGKRTGPIPMRAGFPRTSTSKARTSTAAGSTRRCWCRRCATACRRTRRC